MLRFYRDFMKTAPDELQCYFFFLHVPPLDAFPKEYHGKTAVALIGCYSGDNLEEGEKLLQPIRDFGKPFMEFSQRIQYKEMQKAFDLPKGLRWYSKAHYLSEISDKLIDTIETFTQPLQGAYTMLYFEPMGGAANRKDSADTAFPHRNAAYSLHNLSGWSDTTDDQANIRWAKGFHQALAKEAMGGVYVNLLSHDEEERVKTAYGENWDRLRKLKGKWDPTNLFSANQNILPAD